MSAACFLLIEMTMTVTVSRRAALTSLALAIASPNAFSQTAPDNILNPVIVTATRAPQAAADVLSDNVTIGADEIARAGSGSLIDLLQRQRGIEVARNGGPGTASSVFMRGANSNQNIVLVDGVRIGSSTLGSANWSTLPLSAIDHVEIVYGPLSTMYGADAVGGVIQIFTKKGAGAPRVTAFAGAGGDATRQFDVNVSGATGGEHGFSYALGAGKEKSDGFSSITPGSYYYDADKDGHDKESANGQFGLQLAPGHELGLLFLHSKLVSQFDNGPGYDARNQQQLDNLAVFAKNRFLPNWTSQFQVAQARDKSGSDGGAASYDRSQIDTKQTEVTWQNDIAIGADTLQLLLGHRKEEVEAGIDDALTRDRSTRSVAASYHLRRGPHQASVSARNDDSAQFGSQSTASLGYGYKISGALRASASVGTSFRAPTFNELYYPGYGVASNRPEKGRNAEVGLHFDDGATQLGAVYYRNRVRDLLVYAGVCPVEEAGHPYGCAYNINQALLEGLTLSARRRLGDFHVSANIDLQDPRDQTTDTQLARRAKKHANLAVDYGTGALRGGAELQVSSRRFDDGGNTVTLAGYGLLNLFATYQVAPDWEVLLRWNNATGKHYETAQNFGTAGSTLFAGLRYGIK